MNFKLLWMSSSLNCWCATRSHEGYLCKDHLWTEDGLRTHLTATRPLCEWCSWSFVVMTVCTWMIMTMSLWLVFRPSWCELRRRRSPVSMQTPVGLNELEAAVHTAGLTMWRVIKALLLFLGVTPFYSLTFKRLKLESQLITVDSHCVLFLLCERFANCYCCSCTHFSCLSFFLLSNIYISFQHRRCEAPKMSLGALVLISAVFLLILEHRAFPICFVWETNCTAS